MIHIKPVSKPRLAKKERYYPENEYYHKLSNRTAQFYGHTELRMGFNVSKLAIYEDETDITQDHLLSKYKFFDIPTCYNPWSYNGDIICVTTINSKNLGSDIQFYSFSKKKFVYSRIGNSVALLCSLTSPYVLMTEYDQPSHTSNPYIVDFAGNRIRDIPIKSIPINLFISWLETEMQFIAITKDPLDLENTWLHYGDGKTGKIIDKIPLNPQELVPYARKEIKEVSENKNLIKASASDAYGEMLNEWNYFRFDAKNSLLTLSYFHPIGEIFEDDLFGPSTRIIDYEVDYKLEFASNKKDN